MREKIKEALPKRILALVLMVAMVVTLLPMSTVVVHAATTIEWADEVLYLPATSFPVNLTEHNNSYYCNLFKVDDAGNETYLDWLAPNYVASNGFDYDNYEPDTKYIIYYSSSDGQKSEIHTSIKKTKTLEKYPIWVAGIQVTEDNAGDVLGDADGTGATVTYTPAADGKPATLTLNGLSIGGFGKDHLEYGIKSEEDLNIVIKNSSSIGNDMNATAWMEGTYPGSKSEVNVEKGIYAPDKNITFSGDGALYICDYYAGIEAKNISFGTSDSHFGGEVEIADFGAEANCAITATGNVNIYGGEFQLNSGRNGINADGNVYIEKSNLNTMAGMYELDGSYFAGICGNNVTIKDSEVDAMAEIYSDYGRACGIDANESITISGKDSEIWAEANSDPDDSDLVSYGIGSGVPGHPLISITDATVYALGNTAAIWASDPASGTKPLTIGSLAKPMAIKNAKMLNEDGSAGAAVTEGKGEMNFGYYEDPRLLRAAASGQVSALVVADVDDDETSGYVLIEPATSGSSTSGHIYRPSSSNNNTAPGTTIPVSGEGTSNVTAEVSGNNATVSINSSAINSAAGNTSQDKTDTITVDLSGLKETVTSTTISKTDATNLANALNSAANNKQFVEFKMAEYTVKVDATAMSAVAKAATGNDLRLVVETTAPAAKLNSSQKAEIENKDIARTFEAYFVSNGARIGNFNGGVVQVGVVKFNVPSGKNAKNYHIEYLPESGKAERLKTRYVNGNLIFKTTHFSDYAIVYDEESVNDTGVLAYRLYDKNRGEHIYTIRKAERDMLVNAGWTDETMTDGKNTFYASPVKTDIYDTAVYRSYNPYKADPMKSAHMYTKSVREYNKNVNDGWEKDAGIVFYVAGSSADGENKVVYRAYNPNSPSGEHQWTVSKTELNALIKEGWSDETKGNAWYSPKF